MQASLVPPDSAPGWGHLGHLYGWGHLGVPCTTSGVGAAPALYGLGWGTAPQGIVRLHALVLPDSNPSAKRAA